MQKDDIEVLVGVGEGGERGEEVGVVSKAWSLFDVFSQTSTTSAAVSRDGAMARFISDGLLAPHRKGDPLLNLCRRRKRWGEMMLSGWSLFNRDYCEVS
jgi:hypothetical protein